MNYGEELLCIERLSQREKYLYRNHVTGELELRIRRDPIWDAEKERLMNLISAENKRKIAKELGVSVRKLPKEKY